MGRSQARRTYDFMRRAGASHEVAALKAARGNWNPYEETDPTPDQAILDALYDETCHRCGRALDPAKGETFVSDGLVTCNDHTEV